MATNTWYEQRCQQVIMELKKLASVSVRNDDLKKIYIVTKGNDFFHIVLDKETKNWIITHCDDMRNDWGYGTPFSPDPEPYDSAKTETIAQEIVNICTLMYMYLHYDPKKIQCHRPYGMMKSLKEMKELNMLAC